MSKEIVLYTSKLGIVVFDLAMLGMYIDIPKYYLYIPNRIQNSKYSYVFSLSYKHSLLKAYVNRKTGEFEIKFGTVLLFTTKTLNYAFLNNYKRKVTSNFKFYEN